MALAFWEARHPIQQLRREMDRVLTGFLGNVPDGSGPWSAGRGQPAVNVWECNDALHVEVEVPGIKSDQLDLSVVGGQLSIRVERPELEEEGTAYHRRERPVGTFTRVFRLPVEVDGSRVEAELKNGVLTVRLPKAEAARPRKINVTAK